MPKNVETLAQKAVPYIKTLTDAVRDNDGSQADAYVQQGGLRVIATTCDALPAMTTIGFMGAAATPLPVQLKIPVILAAPFAEDLGKQARTTCYDLIAPPQHPGRMVDGIPIILNQPNLIHPETDFSALNATGMRINIVESSPQRTDGLTREEMAQQLKTFHLSAAQIQASLNTIETEAQLRTANANLREIQLATQNINHQLSNIQNLQRDETLRAEYKQLAHGLTALGHSLNCEPLQKIGQLAEICVGTAITFNAFSQLVSGQVACPGAVGLALGTLSLIFNFLSTPQEYATLQTLKTLKTISKQIDQQFSDLSQHLQMIRQEMRQGFKANYNLQLYSLNVLCDCLSELNHNFSNGILCLRMDMQVQLTHIHASVDYLTALYTTNERSNHLAQMNAICEHAKTLDSNDGVGARQTTRELEIALASQCKHKLLNGAILREIPKYVDKELQIYQDFNDQKLASLIGYLFSAEIANPLIQNYLCSHYVDHISHFFSLHMDSSDGYLQNQITRLDEHITAISTHLDTEAIWQDHIDAYYSALETVKTLMLECISAHNQHRLNDYNDKYSKASPDEESLGQNNPILDTDEFNLLNPANHVIASFSKRNIQFKKKQDISFKMYECLIPGTDTPRVLEYAPQTLKTKRLFDIFKDADPANKARLQKYWCLQYLGIAKLDLVLLDDDIEHRSRLRGIYDDAYLDYKANIRIKKGSVENHMKKDFYVVHCDYAIRGDNKRTIEELWAPFPDWSFHFALKSGDHQVACIELHKAYSDFYIEDIRSLEALSNKFTAAVAYDFNETNKKYLCSNLAVTDRDITPIENKWKSERKILIDSLIDQESDVPALKANLQQFQNALKELDLAILKLKVHAYLGKKTIAETAFLNAENIRNALKKEKIDLSAQTELDLIAPINVALKPKMTATDFQDLAEVSQTHPLELMNTTKHMLITHKYWRAYMRVHHANLAYVNPERLMQQKNYALLLNIIQLMKDQFHELRRITSGFAETVCKLDNPDTHNIKDVHEYEVAYGHIHDWLLTRVNSALVTHFTENTDQNQAIDAAEHQLVQWEENFGFLVQKSAQFDNNLSVFATRRNYIINFGLFAEGCIYFAKLMNYAKDQNFILEPAQKAKEAKLLHKLNEIMNGFQTIIIAIGTSEAVFNALLNDYQQLVDTIIPIDCRNEEDLYNALSDTALATDSMFSGRLLKLESKLKVSASIFKLYLAMCYPGKFHELATLLDASSPLRPFLQKGEHASLRDKIAEHKTQINAEFARLIFNLRYQVNLIKFAQVVREQGSNEHLLIDGNHYAQRYSEETMVFFNRDHLHILEDHLIQYPNINELSIENLNLPTEMVQSISDLVERHAHIERLNLHNTHLKISELALLENVLPRLSTLDLSRNDLQLTDPNNLCTLHLFLIKALCQPFLSTIILDIDEQNPHLHATLNAAAIIAEDKRKKLVLTLVRDDYYTHDTVRLYSGFTNPVDIGPKYLATLKTIFTQPLTMKTDPLSWSNSPYSFLRVLGQMNTVAQQIGEEVRHICFGNNP